MPPALDSVFAAAAAAAAAAEEGFSPAPVIESLLPFGGGKRFPMTAGERARVLPPLRLVVVVRGAPPGGGEPCTGLLDGGRAEALIAIGISITTKPDQRSMKLNVGIAIRVWKG